MDNRNKNRNKVLKQAGILAVAGIIVRIIGLLYGSPLTGIIGDEGNGYYSQAYNWYTIILLISSYSIPSAVSKVISQKLGVGEYKNAQRIFHCAIIYVVIVGAAASLFIMFGAGILVSGNSIPVLRVFAPTIFFFGLLGVLRGFFQGQRNMVPTSVSQILEQIMNALISLSAAYVFIQLVADKDSTTRAVFGAMGSAVGTGAGVVSALLFMLFIYYHSRRSFKRKVSMDRHGTDSYRKSFKIIMMIVTPFILSTFIYNFTNVLDQTIYTTIMEAFHGMSEKDIAISYGIFSRKAVVITNIPIALASAMSTAIMPSISTDYAQGKITDTSDLVERVIRMTMLIAIPSAAGLFALSRPIMLLLYPQRASLDEAAALLAGMAITVVFYSLSTVTNAVLQGIGKVNIPVINAAISLVLQAIILDGLLMFTDLGNYALVISIIIYSLSMCLLNGMEVNRYLRVKANVRKTYLYPAISAAIMGIVSYVAYRLCMSILSRLISSEYFASLISLAIALMVAAFVYAAEMVKRGGVTKADLLSYPKGDKILNIFRKVKLMR